MSLSPQFLDELRARTSLSALIGRGVKLQKAGREFKACCPFHSEKTPSFTVSDEKGFYHCFGCGAHGDAISWLTDQRGLPFMDAVKELADAAGMEVPAPDPKAQARAERAAGLYEVTEAAARWFVEQLDGIEGAAARDYLKRRGISEATRRKFGFGLAPDSRGKLKAALKALGEDRLVEAGLLIAPEEADKAPYDRFRGRLMFPIRDARARCLGFSGRILGDGEPKYLNTPDTPLFDKGRTLFNLDKALPAARAAGRVIVVEGQMDVVALDEAGFAETVAPLGTAMTEAQLGLLWRMSEAPILCFDGDSAGQKAAVRAALRALPGIGPARSLAFVTLPPGEDPDDLVRGRGREALEALLAAPEALVDRLWRHEAEAGPLATPEQRAGLRKRLLDHVSAIADADVREQYRAEFLDRFYARFQSKRSAGAVSFVRRVDPQVGRFLPSQGPRPDEMKAIGAAGTGSDWQPWSRAVMLGLIRYPDQIGEHTEAIDFLQISDDAVSKLRDLLLESAMTHGELDREALDTILAARGAAALLEALSLKRGLAFSFTRANAEPARACRDLALVIETLAARPGLDAALAAATARVKDGGDEAAFEEQTRLLLARHEADRKLATLFESEAD